MNFKKLQKIRGSVALMSVLIISAVLIIAVVASSQIQMNSSRQYFNDYADGSTYYLAEGCMEDALSRLEEDPGFVNGNLTEDDFSCSMTVTGNNIDIVVNYKDYTQNFRGIYEITTNGQANNANLLTWEEL